MSMGTQYRFTLEDTNRDGAPVPDVFVVGDTGMNAAEFLGYLMSKSGNFYDAARNYGDTWQKSGYKAGREEVFEDIVKWWIERDRNPNDSVETLIRDWDLPTQRRFTVTVTFDGLNSPLVISGVEADDEADAERKVSDGVSASYEWDYSGPGELDEDPFGDQVIYVESVEAEEEE